MAILLLVILFTKLYRNIYGAASVKEYQDSKGSVEDCIDKMGEEPRERFYHGTYFWSLCNGSPEHAGLKTYALNIRGLQKEYLNLNYGVHKPVPSQGI